MTPPVSPAARLRPVVAAAAALAAIVILELVRQHSYPLFHSMVEMAAVAVAGGVFLLTWSVRRGMDNGSLLVAGLAYGGVALLDLLHTVTYTGMAPGSDPNLATQFWVASRLLEAVALAGATAFAGRRLPAWPVLLAVTTVTGLLLATIRPWRVFPDCFVVGRGLTAFKIGAEVAVCVLLAAAAAGLVALRRHFDRHILATLLASIGFTVAGEVLFTLYAGPFDFVNALGHYCKLASFVFVYRAIIATTVGDPSRVLFGDLSRQKEAYQSERDRLCAILDSLVDPVCIIDGDRRVEYVNAAMANTFGPAGADGRCHLYLYGQAEPCANCGIAAVVAGQTRRRDATLAGRDYDVIETAIPNADGSRSKLSVYRDVTDSKRAAADVAASEAKYRTLFESMLDGVALHEIVTDDDGRAVDYRFVEVNAAFCALTGLEKEAVEGRLVTEVIPGIERDPADWIGRYGRVALEGAEERFENWSERLERWFAVSVYAPGPGRFCTVFRDITARKRNEEALLENQRQLAAALDDLAVQSSQLQRANRELKAFTSMASHDLRAPLRLASTYADLLREDLGEDLSAEAAEHLERIIAVNRRMDRLIEDIHTLSRIDREEMRWEDVDLTGLVGECVAELRETHPDHQPEVVVAPGLRARGDRGLLRSLLTNLVGNAWKYSAGCEAPRIELRCGTVDGATSFEVVDNGVGFPPEAAERIFDPFVRAHQQQRFPGSGIGLSICARIVARHGGTISASSDGRRGATVRFTLGQAPASAADGPRPEDR